MSTTRLSRTVIAVAVVGLVSLAVGSILAQSSLAQSWHTWTPPGETQSRTVFWPYWATLIPSVALLFTGALGASAIMLDLRASGEGSRQVFFLTYGSLSLASGILMFVHGLLYSLFIVCSNPGGCQDLFLPFWPAFLPGLLMVVVGPLSVRSGMGARGPTSPQPLTRSP